jgi:hypothetical protein
MVQYNLKVHSHFSNLFFTALSNPNSTRCEPKLCLDYESLEITVLVDEAVKQVVKLVDELIKLVITVVVVIERLS